MFSRGECAQAEKANPYTAVFCRGKLAKECTSASDPDRIRKTEAGRMEFFGKDAYQIHPGTAAGRISGRSAEIFRVIPGRSRQKAGKTGNADGKRLNPFNSDQIRRNPGGYTPLATLIR